MLMSLISLLRNISSPGCLFLHLGKQLSHMFCSMQGPFSVVCAKNPTDNPSSSKTRQRMRDATKAHSCSKATNQRIRRKAKKLFTFIFTCRYQYLQLQYITVCTTEAWRAQASLWCRHLPLPPVPNAVTGVYLLRPSFSVQHLTPQLRKALSAALFLFHCLW